MPAVTVSQMVAAEQSAMRKGWTEASLMALAGEALGHAIGRHFTNAGTAIAYLGKGHNAGDALIALAILQKHYSWHIDYRAAYALDDCSPLTRKHAAALSSPPLANCPQTHRLRYPLLLIDGLLGTGSRGAPRSPILELCKEMQQLRNQNGALIASVDIPSGMDANQGHANDGAITADITFMIGNAKLGLLMSHATAHTGSLAIVPVAPLTIDAPGEMELVAPQTMDFSKAPRAHDIHKGSAGKVTVLAGSAQYPGAAILAATGALRGGAGMVRLHVPSHILSTVSARAAPEIIICPYDEISQICADDADARIVGCGLGELSPSQAQQCFDWISTSSRPTVIDADGINLIAHYKQHSLLRESHLITPHPGEFKRLAPELAALPREQAAAAFAQQYPSTLLLKGARSIIAYPNQPLWCNSTGNSGMATAGQGDLLSGVAASRLAAGAPPNQAAALAAWICGRAAEIAVNTCPCLSPESLTTSDVAQHLGAAYMDWQSGRR